MEIPLAAHRRTRRLTGLALAVLFVLVVGGLPLGCAGRMPRAPADAAIAHDPGWGPRALVSVDTPGGHAVLHRPSGEVPHGAPGLPQLLTTMETVAHDHQAGGLAAVQVGVPMRVILLRREADDHSSRLQTLIDPTVLARSRQRIGSWERCLSVPWGYRYTDRSAGLEVRYRDPAGGWHQEHISGGEAAVLQHELDHLDGRLLSDGLTREAFIPESRMAAVAAAARDDCRAAGRTDCRAFMRSRWTSWRQAP